MSNQTSPIFAEFKCPQCGGSHFGRDIGEVDGELRGLDTLRCHDEFHKACDWHGVWDEKSEPKDLEAK